MIPAFMAVFLF